MLIGVTNPAGAQNSRQYHYESSAGSGLLTGVSINSVRRSTYSYYADKRVHQSGTTNGEARETLSYATNQTTATNAAGHSVTYSFQEIGGVKHLSNTTRAGTTTCGATVATTVYHPSKQVDHTLDWNGNRTQYQYDGSWRIQSVTTAAGTQSQQTEALTWEGLQTLVLLTRTILGANNVAFQRTSYT
ncbi:MAG: hypothetical protein LW768_03415 [Rubrivivax sp.]|jgi:YD repeat-containing protein|nr:hypothetical protein [Rubrivivax sp.]